MGKKGFAFKKKVKKGSKGFPGRPVFVAAKVVLHLVISWLLKMKPTWTQAMAWYFPWANIDPALYHHVLVFNSLRPRQNGRHFPDDIFKCIFLNENVWIRIKISLKFVPKGPINNCPSLVQIMAWRWPGDKPLSGLMMVTLLTYMN